MTVTMIKDGDDHIWVDDETLQPVEKPEHRNRTRLSDGGDPYCYTSQAEGESPLDILRGNVTHYCPKCSTQWSAESPHDCRTLAIVEALTRLAEDADANHDELLAVSLYLAAKVAEYEQRFEDMDARLEGTKQIELPFADEAVKQALSSIYERIDKAERRAELALLQTAGVAKLSQDLQAVRALVEKDPQEDVMGMRISAVVDQMKELKAKVDQQAQEIAKLREENVELSSRIEESEEGLFG